MGIHPFRLIKLVTFVLFVGVAIISGLQLQAETDVLLFCPNTGQPCRSDLDCGRANPTCFCGNVNPTTGVGSCRDILKVTNQE
jgi:hypothetical protein